MNEEIVSFRYWFLYYDSDFEYKKLSDLKCIFYSYKIAQTLFKVNLKTFKILPR